MTDTVFSKLVRWQLAKYISQLFPNWKGSVEITTWSDASVSLHVMLDQMELMQSAGADLTEAELNLMSSLYVANPQYQHFHFIN